MYLSLPAIEISFITLSKPSSYSSDSAWFVISSRFLTKGRLIIRSFETGCWALKISTLNITAHITMVIFGMIF